MLTILIILILLFLLMLYCFYVYGFRRSQRRNATDTEIPNSSQYACHREPMLKNIQRMIAESCEEVHIPSYDGLTLRGRYYHYHDNAPVAIMFHGYRSTALRDSSGGFWLFQEKGFNILLVDQRAHGKSQGKTISFGIKERFDCRDWITYIADRFGADIPIYLLGVSMGAGTVLMASELELKGNVRGIIADCGYSTIKGILTDVAKAMHFPPRISYALVRLAAILFGGFDPDEASPAGAIANSPYPFLFIHGEDDRLVYLNHGHENYIANGERGTILTVPGAGHATSFYTDYPGYRNAVLTFIDKTM